LGFGDKVRQAMGLEGVLANTSEHDNNVLTRAAIQYILAGTPVPSIDRSKADDKDPAPPYFLPPASQVSFDLAIPQKITPTWGNTVIEQAAVRYGTIALQGIVFYGIKNDLSSWRADKGEEPPLATRLLSKTFEQLRDGNMPPGPHYLLDLFTGKGYMVEIVQFSLKFGGPNRSAAANWNITFRILAVGVDATSKIIELTAPEWKTPALQKLKNTIGKYAEIAKGYIKQVAKILNMASDFLGFVTDLMDTCTSVLDEADDALTGAVAGVSQSLNGIVLSANSLVNKLLNFKKFGSVEGFWGNLFNKGMFTQFTLSTRAVRSDSHKKDPMAKGSIAKALAEIDTLHAEMGKKTAVAGLQDATVETLKVGARTTFAAIQAYLNALANTNPGVRVSEESVLPSDGTFEEVLMRILGPKALDATVVQRIININNLRPPYLSPSRIPGTVWRGDKLKIPATSGPKLPTMGNAAWVYQKPNKDFRLVENETGDLDIAVVETKDGFDLSLTEDAAETFTQWFKVLTSTVIYTDASSPTFGIPLEGIGGRSVDVAVADLSGIIRTWLEADDRVVSVDRFEISDDGTDSIAVVLDVTIQTTKGATKLSLLA